jgi:hypothetical protein
MPEFSGSITLQLRGQTVVAVPDAADHLLTVASVAGNLKTTDALWNGALNANWSTSDTMAVRASKAAISATFIRMAMRTMALSRPRYLMAP